MDRQTKREQIYASLLFHYCVKAVKRIEMYDDIEYPKQESICEMMSIATSFMTYGENERVQGYLLTSSSDSIARSLNTWDAEDVIRYIMDKHQTYNDILMNVFANGSTPDTADYSHVYNMIYHYPMRPVTYPYHEPEDKDAFARMILEMLGDILNGKEKAERICGMGAYQGIRWWKRIF